MGIAIVPDPVVRAISLEAYRVPTITAYNRLEASPRAADFARSLRAEVRDALWMLTRQWQFGEFQADDAGSPVTSRIVAEHTTTSHVEFPQEDRFDLDPSMPLETLVERERLHGNLFLATEMARYFLRLLRADDLERLLPALRERFPLEYVIEKNDADGHQLMAAVGEEWFDGWRLHVDIITIEAGESRFQAWMTAEGITTADQEKLLRAAGLFEAWIGRAYSQPVAQHQAWLPAQLEYGFNVANAQLNRRLIADQYSTGHLDWYSFDYADSKPTPGAPNVVSFIPGPVAFTGMPNPRFWMLEDGHTDFGTLDTSKTGLLHLLFAEFGLIYGNDWFVLPYPQTINKISEIFGIRVTDVFGQHSLILPAGRNAGSSWQKWSMFAHTNVGPENERSLYYLAPTLTKTLQGEPLERVALLRDEMANLVWAIERTVPSQGGKGVNGNEMAWKTAAQPAFAPVNDNVQIRYVAGTTVPDNWIPFIPVPKEGSAREIRLQRARMPGARGPLGVVLTEKAAPYYVNEEEVPRAGIEVRRAFQRARWLDGRTYLWIGRRKETGAGEGWSNLRFDQIADIAQNVK